MVENATERIRRGRPPKFDHDAVVDAAIGAFFAKGFEATTLTDLEVATGVDRSTLYNSFGGKSGLYHNATERYLDQAVVELFQQLHDGSDDGLADVIGFLEQIRSWLTSSNVSPGCLIVNDMAAGSDPDAAKRYRDLLDTGLRVALQCAADRGVIEPGSVENRAALVSAAVIGINLISRHTGDNCQVDRLVSGAIAEAASWRREAN